MLIERIKTFTGGIKVVENTHIAKEFAGGIFPKMKIVYLHKNSPLRAAGVDHFQLQVRRSGKNSLFMIDKNGIILNKTGLTSEVKMLIKAIKKNCIKLR